MTLALNDLRALSVRLTLPWLGVWTAEVKVELRGATAPTGRAVLTIGKTVLVGTIDPTYSGGSTTEARVRVLGGGGGWQSIVPARHYKNDAGVLCTTVYATTAAAIGETVTATPKSLGPDYVRRKGPASTVLDGETWYVDITGVTIVGPRASSPAPKTVDLLSFDPGSRIATISADEVLVPGTTFEDRRYGALTVREVEQTFGEGGATAKAWCAQGTASATPEPGGQLLGVLKAIAKGAHGGALGETHRYVVVGQAPDGRFTIKPAGKGDSVPPMKAISLSPAIPGLSVKVPPGTVVHVEFLEGDPKRPVVTRFEEGSAIEVKVDTMKFSIATGAKPVACAAEIVAWAANVNAALNTLGAPVAPLAPTVAATKLFTE